MIVPVAGGPRRVDCLRLCELAASAADGATPDRRVRLDDAASAGVEQFDVYRHARGAGSNLKRNTRRDSGCSHEATFQTH